jgi:hypothetical protein
MRDDARMGVSATPLDEHAHLIGEIIDQGRLIPFLGAGANLCDRPQIENWQPGDYLPSGGELALYLAGNVHYPGADPSDLGRVAQYVDLKKGEGGLFDDLRPLFMRTTYEPNTLHRFLASLPARQRAAGVAPALMVTTNYDDVLEQAFEDAGEPVDVVCYFAQPGKPGRFDQVTPDGDRRPIPKRGDDSGLDLDNRPVILKIHGAVDRHHDHGDSYVITEDHYIDYLAHGGVARLLPACLMARMCNSHFLFLGYRLRDWNLRVVLRYIWSQQARGRKSWAVEREPDPIDQEFWQHHSVDIVPARLEEWVAAMSRARA